MQKWARFRDMRPSRVDSNLYNYHLKLLQKRGLVEKVEGKGYRLSATGMQYVDYVSVEQFETRRQPKLITKLYIHDGDGNIVMWPKYKQPFIGLWSLPSGKIHADDANVVAAAKRELAYLTDAVDAPLQHRGVLEIRSIIQEVMITHTIEHLFVLQLPRTAVAHELATWQPLSVVDTLECSPGTTEAIYHVANEKDFFFESYDLKV